MMANVSLSSPPLTTGTHTHTHTHTHNNVMRINIFSENNHDISCNMIITSTKITTTI